MVTPGCIVNVSFLIKYSVFDKWSQALIYYLLRVLNNIIIKHSIQTRLLRIILCEVIEAIKSHHLFDSYDSQLKCLLIKFTELGTFSVEYCNALYNYIKHFALQIFVSVNCYLNNVYFERYIFIYTYKSTN